ncbi:MAG: hypothetical protein IPM69_19115 [Ignavibacteria bacterium]|nr:hypothetical protein [Ignavibacteria bacterium]
MENEFRIGFTLQSIKNEQFALFNENYVYTDEGIFSVGVEVKISEDKRIGVFLQSQYLQGDRVVIKIVVSCHFIINDESWISFLDIEESNIVIPQDVLAYLVLVTAGTTRGILFAKTEGTVFSTVIFPAIDGSELIKEDAKIPLKTKNGYSSNV